MRVDRERTGRSFRGTGLAIAVLLLLVALPQMAQAVVLHPGDIVITADILPALPGGGDDYGLVRIDPVTGDRTIISDQTIGTGVPMPTPDAVAIAPDGSLLVADLLEGIERIDPATGDRTLIKPALLPTGVHQVDNEIYFTEGTFWGFDATTLQTNFVANGTGPLFNSGPGQPGGFAIIGNEAYVALAQTQLDPVDSNCILGVNLTSGDRTLISGTSFIPKFVTAGSGPALTAPSDVAVDPAGQLLVTSGLTAGVMRIDPVTGARTIVTSNSVGTGPQFPTRDPFYQEYRLAIAGDGTILLNEWDAGGVWAVDPITGNRTIVSDATHGAGPLLGSTTGGGGIAVVPAPEPATLVLAALGGLALVAASLKRPH